MAAIRKECPACGHVTCVYSHNLNRPLVSALRQLVDFYETCRRPANLQQDLSLTKRAGSRGWVPTVEGTGFVYGLIRIRTTALTFAGEVLPFDHEAWKDRSFRIASVRVIDEASYKQPAEYKAEKSGPPAQPSFWGENDLR
jgi:hypothetical protein